MSKTKFNAVLLSALSAAMLPGAAHATSISYSDAATFTVSNSVSTAQANSFTTAQTIGSSQINQFNKNTGVLTGVSVGVTSTYKQTTNVTVGSSDPNSATQNSYSATGTGASAIAVKIPQNVTSAQTASTTQSISDTCGNTNKNNCNDGTSTNTVNSNVSASSSNLASYAGSGTFTVEELALKNTATVDSNTFAKTANTTSTIDWTGSLVASYSYLLHASQSFSTSGSQTTLTLDFGNIYRNDAVGDLAFSISNLLGDRVGLSLTGFTEVGDTNNLFTTSLALFSNLGAGATNNYTASFLANTAGSFGATYNLTLADAAPDGAYAANTLLSNYALTLNLKANVIDRPAPPQDDPAQGQSTAVPEPGSLALLGLGGLLFGLSRKRRKA